MFIRHSYEVHKKYIRSLKEVQKKSVRSLKEICKKIIRYPQELPILRRLLEIRKKFLWMQVLFSLSCLNLHMRADDWTVNIFWNLQLMELPFLFSPSVSFLFIFVFSHRTQSHFKACSINNSTMVINSTTNNLVRLPFSKSTRVISSLACDD